MKIKSDVSQKGSKFTKDKDKLLLKYHTHGSR